MTPRNLAVKALQALPSLRTKLDSPGVHMLADALEGALKTSTTFLLPDDLFSDKRDIAKLVGLIRLPVEPLVLETESLAMLAVRSPIATLPDSILIWPILATGLAPTGFTIRESDIPSVIEHRSIQTTPIHLLPSGEIFLENADPQNYFSGHLAALGELCALLACRNVITEIIPAPARLNAARVKRGKPPLRDYHTLVIKLNEVKHIGGGNPCGQHASPRRHIRRGHIRHLEKGPIWVNAAIVNLGKNWVEKRYELRA